MKCIQLSLAFGSKANGALTTTESHFLLQTVIIVIDVCVCVCVCACACACACVCVCARARVCVRAYVGWRLSYIKVQNSD